IRGAEFLFRKLIRDWREASLGLSVRPRGNATPSGTLYAYSPHVVPVPSDWDRTVLVSGYWFLDNENWQPPDALTSFLDAGEAPIDVGFGSMPGLDPQKTTSIIIEALARAGKRGLLASGGG